MQPAGTAVQDTHLMATWTGIGDRLEGAICCGF
jgi:hypothetical protein